MTNQERITALKASIEKWDKEYYEYSNSSVSDAVYDAAVKELSRLEGIEKYLQTSPSILDKVSGKPSMEYQQHDHRIPMLSIHTETNSSLESLESWKKAREEELGEQIEMIGEPKYDGVALSLEYSDKKLQRALTRGDGMTGEDVTRAASYLDIPLLITEDGDITIRGEVVIHKENFLCINQALELEGKPPLSNPRNAASGALRSKDPLVVKERRLRFYPYALHPPRDTQLRSLAYINHLGFTNMSLFYLSDQDRTESTFSIFEKLSKDRDKLPFEIDGVVFKVDSAEQAKRLGTLLREPRHMVAFKFPPRRAYSTLIGIHTQVGRTGKLTPVGEIQPTHVGSVTISHVTLHNTFDLRRRKIRVGQIVEVRRAGDVIPELVKADIEQPYKTYHPNFHFPKTCPSCHAPVERPKGSVEYYCTGLQCPAQLENKILHFVSKRAMNIQGLGVRFTQALIEYGLLSKISDIYNLTKENLMQIGIGEKYSFNLIQAIESSKSTTFARLLYAMGVLHVGESACKTLATKVSSFSELMALSDEELCSVPGIGPITTKSIRSFLSHPKTLEEVLYIEGLLTIKNNVKFSQKLEGKTFAITGSFSSDGKSREDIKNLITSHGGIFVSSVSAKTSYLVQGEGGGIKTTEAQRYQVPIISLSELMDLVS